MVAGVRINLVKNQIDRGGVAAKWYSAIPCITSTYTVTNETQKLIPRPFSVDDYCTLNGKTSIIGATVTWTEPDTNVISGSVIVTDVAGTTIFTENIDYTIDYEAGEIIKTDVSRIPPLSYIKISYRWQQPCVSPETGNPRDDFPQCNGNGVTYSIYTSIIGLLHIPKYESPLTKIGFFELGDAIFTTTSLDKIKATGYGNTDDLYRRDILVINDGTMDQVWRVIAKPETIQLQNEYLAHKVHIRKVKEGESMLDLIRDIT
jgi:hypothetical protein